jgi:putative membrane protein
MAWRSACVAMLALPGTNVLAASLGTTYPAQPLQEIPPAAPRAVDTWSPGSASLMPLMAADLPARHSAIVDVAGHSPSGAGKSLDDIAFIRQAAASGRREISSARDALPKLRDPALRQIAARLMADHGDLTARLARLAGARDWTIPSPEASSAPAAGAASDDFEARWTARTIAAHEKSVALYGAQAQSGDDPELRRFARDTLPVIERHLAELKGLQK